MSLNCVQMMLYDRHVHALQRIVRHYQKGFVSFGLEEKKKSSVCMFVSVSPIMHGT